MQQKRIKFIKPLLISLVAGYLIYHFYSAYYYIADIDASDLSLKTLKGESVSADTILNGKTIVVFFQTWCAPCIQEMRLINSRSPDFNFVKICFITDESPQKVKQLIERMHITNVQILLSDKALTDIGITAFPTTYFFKGKKCVEKHKGTWIDESNYEDELYHLKKLYE